MGGRRRAVLALLALTLLGASACEPVPPMPGSVASSLGIQYGTGDTRTGPIPMLFDLYAPGAPTRGRRPVVVLLHGGGFQYLDRGDDRIIEIARALAKRGIVAVSMDYRLAWQDPVASSRVQGLLPYLRAGDVTNAMVCAVDDTLVALEFLRSHADSWNIDPDRIGLVGASAGAITADHVAYAIDDHGISRPRISFVGSLWGAVFISSPAGRNVDPATQLEAGEAPLFVVHGEADADVPFVNSEHLIAQAKAVGVRNEFIRVPGAGHAYDETGFFTRKVNGDQTALDRLVEFAVAELKP